jgi:hypothetical protein
VVGEGGRRYVEEASLRVVRIRHHAAAQVRARARDLGDQVTHEATGARLAEGDRHTGGASDLAEAAGEARQGFEVRLLRHSG